MRYLKDLLLTDICLLKGHVNCGGQRLSKFLNATPKRYVEMEEVTLADHSRAELSHSPRVLVRVDEILLAHEMDDAGDEALKILAERDRDDVPVTAGFGGVCPVQVAGQVSRRVMEREPAGAHDFIVIVDPRISGLPGKATAEYDVFQRLPYVIANRERIVLFRW